MDRVLAKLEGCGYLAVVFMNSDLGYFEMWKKLRCTFLSAGCNCVYGFASDSGLWNQFLQFILQYKLPTTMRLRPASHHHIESEVWESNNQP